MAVNLHASGLSVHGLPWWRVIKEAALVPMTKYSLPAQAAKPMPAKDSTWAQPPWHQNATTFSLSPSPALLMTRMEGNASASCATGGRPTGESSAT